VTLTHDDARHYALAMVAAKDVVRGVWGFRYASGRLMFGGTNRALEDLYEAEFIDAPWLIGTRPVHITESGGDLLAAWTKQHGPVTGREEEAS
jgi:hypothetical protein